MKKRLLEIFNSHDYQPKNFEELFAFMGLEDSERDDLEKALSELLDEYEVLLSRKKRYILPRTVNIYKGQISIKNPDFGFITSPDFERDFYVSKSGFNGAMDRDHVVFQALGEYNDSDSFKQEAKVIDILKRNLTTLVGNCTEKGTILSQNEEHRPPCQGRWDLRPIHRRGCRQSRNHRL